MSATPAPQLDERDAWLLDALQRDFPLEPRPWGAIARRRGGLDGAAVLDRVRALRGGGIIRQISPIFNTHALGYHSALVAAKVDEARIDAAAAVVSAHPGVSHNYRREAAYNLWFTFATPPGRDMAAGLDQLAARAGLECYRPLPTLRTFHIGVRLNLRDEVTAGATRPRDDEPGEHRLDPVPLSEFDRRAVRITQDDLPLVEEPFAAACAALGVSFDELRGWFAAMKGKGVLRRLAAILRHRSAGFTANGMAAWRVPQDAIEAAGRAAATFEAVSHCYQRPAYADWPYHLYTMVHARTRASCEAIVSQIASALGPLGVSEHRILYSTHEYKKERVRYFCEDESAGPSVRER